MSSSDARSNLVLVVEDEPSIRRGVLLFLKEAGFITYEAESADEAIRILEQQDGIRLILTDINMPGSMNGLQFAHFVRNRWPPIKVIVTSGRVDVDEHDLPTEAVFVGKPYLSDHIVNVVRVMIAA